MPKDYPSQVREVAEVLPQASITCLLESPLGVERAFDIASAAVTLGEADLSGAVGVDTDEGLAWCGSPVLRPSREGQHESDRGASLRFMPHRSCYSRREE